MNTTKLLNLTERHLETLNNRRLVTQFRVTSIVASSPTIKAGLSSLLGAIGSGMDWDVGEFWKVAPHKQALTFHSHWCRPSLDVSELVAFNRAHSFEKGEGTPGIAWALGQPLWTEEVTMDACFYRKTLAANHGLHSSVAFPVSHGKQVIGVILFFTRYKKQDDEELKRVLGDIGTQIGHFVFRKEQEIELRRLNEELRAFTRTVSHDLRDPLCTIIGNLNIALQKVPGSPNEKQYLERALQRANGMATFISDLLEYCYLGKETRLVESIDLNQIVQEVLSNLEASIRDSRASIMIPTSLPVLHLEKSCALPLFQNLISNAIKYRARERSPEIKIEATTENGSWLVTIEDNGVGIPKDQWSTVFQPFMRVDSQKCASQGHGLGLATCKRIVDRYNGTISLHSELDRGTTFYIRLPRYS